MSHQSPKDDFAARFVCDSLCSFEFEDKDDAEKVKDLTEKRFSRLPSRGRGRRADLTGSLADALREEYPSTAEMFEEMRRKKWAPRPFVCDVRQRFGDHIPLIGAKT